MSQVFDTGGWLPNTLFRTYAKQSLIVKPTDTWVFIEEHPNSINDGAFAVQMYDPPKSTDQPTIIDMPASFHNGSCALSFSDGHAEMHKWLGNSIKLPVNPNATAASRPTDWPVGDSAADLLWLSSKTTVANN